MHPNNRPSSGNLSTRGNSTWRNGTRHPDAFVVINIGEETKNLELEIPGSTSTTFDAFRSSDDERYVALGGFIADAHQITYPSPPRSVTTFFGNG